MDRAKNCQPIAPTVHFDMRQTVTVYSPLKRYRPARIDRPESGTNGQALFCSSTALCSKFVN